MKKYFISYEHISGLSNEREAGSLFEFSLQLEDVMNNPKINQSTIIVRTEVTE